MSRDLPLGSRPLDPRARSLWSRSCELRDEGSPLRSLETEAADVVFERLTSASSAVWILVRPWMEVRERADLDPATKETIERMWEEAFATPPTPRPWAARVAQPIPEYPSMAGDDREARFSDAERELSRMSVILEEEAAPLLALAEE